MSQIYKYRYFSSIKLLLINIILVMSCSTQKDAFLNRANHQINTKYNGLFYAKEHLNAGIKKIHNLHINDYNNFLTINKFGNAKSAQSAKSSLDLSIEKATKSIQKHSMDIDGEEKNKFIEKNYLIIGRAKFYKQEYAQAINTFSYTLRKTQSQNTKIEALLWSTLCHSKLKNKEAVRNNINTLNDDYILNDHQRSILFEIESEAAIQKGYYLEAINHLENALELSKVKEKKVRINYILGQLQVKTKNMPSAQKHFLAVIKKSTDYELLFNAQLSMAKAYDPLFSNNDVEEELIKMTKDKKNTEYLDQVYFAIGSINLKKSDTTSAISALKLSSSLSQFNIEQKSNSHFALANIFWDQKDYVASFNHCDTAFQLTKPKALNYEEIKLMLKSSKKIAHQFRVINHNDSLINLARLPIEERNSVIDDYISNLKQQELKANEDNNPSEKNRFNQYDYNRQTTNSMQVASGGGWYFYNPSAISLGYSEFLSRWGNRELEDNWRRKNKSDEFLEDDTSADYIDDQPNESEKYNREYYISKLPIEIEDQAKLLSKVEAAYYNLAVIFKELLQDYTQSLQTYTQLLARFPESDYRPLIYFDSYNIHLLQNDSILAQNVFDKIKYEYPGSDYYKLLLGQEISIDKRDLDGITYESAYEFYLENSDQSCKDLSELAQNIYDNVFIAEIQLLNIFCQAKKTDRQSYINKIEKLIQEYPKSNIKLKLDTLLMSLKADNLLSKDSLFQNNPKGTYSFFIHMKDIEINLPETQRSISQFNKREYKLDSLEIVNLLLNKSSQLIKVQTFKNKLAAESYFNLIKKEDHIKEMVNEKKIELFIINELNFLALIKEKGINKYRDYFNKIYLLN